MSRTLQIINLRKNDGENMKDVFRRDEAEHDHTILEHSFRASISFLSMSHTPTSADTQPFFPRVIQRLYLIHNKIILDPSQT